MSSLEFLRQEYILSWNIIKNRIHRNETELFCLANPFWQFLAVTLMIRLVILISPTKPPQIG